MNHAEGQALFLDTPGAGSAGKGALHKLMQRTLVQAIEDADAILIVGSNPRREAALVNARIRKRSVQGRFPIGVIEHADHSFARGLRALGERVASAIR